MSHDRPLHRPRLTDPYPATVVKLDSFDQPPPLYYSPDSSDRGRESTVESTPINTPSIGQASPPFGRPSRKDKDLYFSWHRKPNDLYVGNRHSSVDPDVLFEDEGDCSFPLFPSPPGMATTSASPIDITGGRRFNSQSPRNNQPSNLQFALQEAEAPDVAASEMYAGQRPGNDGRLSVGGRNDSISGGSYYGSGARPISMKDRPRRESTANGSLLNGMSWGGISVGSWVRDE